MGLFLEWAILRGLASPELMTSAPALRNRSKTGLDLLFDQSDGKLMDDDFGEEGNAFATAIYEAHYLDDFIAVLALVRS